MADFDWVNARAACSVARVFEEIRMQIVDDVSKRNAQRGETAHYKFDTITQGDSIAVILDGNNVPTQRVTFTRTPKGITVHDTEGTRTLEASLTLSHDGECRLKVKGEEREFWQFRRMALEHLFFDIV